MQTATPELEILFVDQDAYFASCEQLDNPELRGKPVGITPTPGPSGCCIACSYEARAFGVKTGCRVGDALRLCPEIRIVRARPDRYVQLHHQILAAIESVVPVTEIESVDECWCRLLSNEQSPEQVREIAGAIKRAIAQRIGPLGCSIGVSSNRLLAKVAASMSKPDGFTMLPRSSLPGPLLDLELTDFPGIARGVNRRLRAAGIQSVKDLYARSPAQLRSAWGSVLGVYWWHWIRGEHLPGPKTHRRTVGHQHVLAPKFRSRDQAMGVSVRLLAKAAQRMRSLGYVASRLSLVVHPVNKQGVWWDWTPLPATDDTFALQGELFGLWEDAPRGDVLQVGVRLEGLEHADAQMQLFPEQQSRRALMQAMDLINRRNGADMVFPASMFHQRKTAPRRIPFGAPPDLDLPDFDGAA